MDQLVEPYVRLIRFLGQTLPSTFEMILFDTTDKSLPVLTRVNRMNGTHDVSKKLVKKVLQSEILKKTGCVLNTPQQSELKKIIKSSVYLIKDENDAPKAAVCVNMQCDIYLEMQTLVSSVLQFSPVDIGGLEKEAVEAKPMEAGYSEPALDMITKAVEECGVEPERISLNERLEIICDLYNAGVFERKGAVAKTAQELKISEQSIYRYLAKIKKARS